MNSRWSIQQAARLIQQGGVIACPTEAVWGLSCDPWNIQAVARLLDLKQRPVEKGLILVAASDTQFDFLLKDLPNHWQRQLAQSWPGPNTWLVPHQGRLPHWITGGRPKVALRVTAHPWLAALCAQTGPLVSSSANPTGRPPARSRLRLEQYFHRRLQGVLPGQLGGQQNPSLIRDLESGAVIRAA